MFGYAITPAIKGAIIFVIAVVLFSFGYYKGHSNEKIKFDAFKAKVAAAAAEQEAKVKVINETNAKVAKETANAYKNNLSAVRNYYNGVFNNGSNSMPNLSSTTTGTDAAPTYDVLTRQCAETTLQVVTLQEFIKSTAVNY